MDTALRALIVEDSEDDAALVLRELRKGGYDPRSERVDSAPAMKEALDREGWDIVLADYRMPRFGAPAALALLKESELDLPFIVVSGTVGEDVAVAVMKAGAHDCVMKSNLARLVPAVARELREAEMRQEQKQAQAQLATQKHVLEMITTGAPLADVLADPELQDPNPSNVQLIDIATRIAAIARARQRAEEAQRLLGQRLAMAEEKERRRLAYDFHDGLMQMIQAADMHCEAILARPHVSNGTTHAQIERISQQLKEAIHEGRRIVSELRPAPLDDFGLIEAARSYLHSLATHHGWQFELNADLQDWTPLPHVETALFRIVQEALSNAAKHAQTDRVAVSLALNGKTVRLEVKDWGRGFDADEALLRAARGDSLGLVGMQERTRLLGGSWNVVSEQGRGTVITATIPLATTSQREGAASRG